MIKWQMAKIWLEGVGLAAGKIALILAATWLADMLVKTVVRHLDRPRRFSLLTLSQRRRRWKTVTSLIVTTAKIIINFIGFLLILDILGINLAPFLAGAGIIGLAVGFGAKTLVSDLIAGFFILLENQFNVNDWIKVGNYQGQVQKISLRTVILKDKSGNSYIIPNSAIKTVIRLHCPPKKQMEI